MSDMQDLIHVTTIKAYERGQKDTEDRIIAALKAEKDEAVTAGAYDVALLAAKIISLIQERNK